MVNSFKTYLYEQYYYHGTSHENAQKILKSGTDNDKSLFDKKIYLTKNFGEAQKYSKIASGGKLGKVLKVHRSNLKDHEIHDEHSGIIQYSGKIKPEHFSEV